MIDTKKMEEAISLLGELTAEQRAVVQEAFTTHISESELFQKLGTIKEEAFTKFLNAMNDVKESSIFDQKLSENELNAVSGGGDVVCGFYAVSFCDSANMDDPSDNCSFGHARSIYGGNGFPNCASTVEDGSWCNSADACIKTAVDYKGMNSCDKAWK